MSYIFQLFADNQVLLLFFLVGSGAILAKIRIKGVSLGAASVLFLSIGLTAWALHSGYKIEVEHDLGVLGLALFAFAIGISSGPNFFNTIKSSVLPIILMLVSYVLAAGVAAGIGRGFGMDWALIAGTFAGATTNTPALSAASAASGNPALATVGYAISYLFGVIGMLIIASIALSRRSTDKDKPSPISNRTIRVERTDHPTIESLRDTIGGTVHFSRIRRGETGPIWLPSGKDVLHQDDLVTVIGTDAEVAQAIKLVGHGSSHSLIADRRYLDFRRVTISNSAIAGRKIGSLDLEEKYGGTISRIRRGDTDMAASPRLRLQLGDRVRIVAPTHSMAAISKYFGDSAHGLTDINPVALGLGMALGILIGEWEILTPSGLTFSIGSAAGTLIVGLVMGRLGRVGNIVTTLPYTTCQVLSELGLLVFLAYAGTKAGSQILVAFTGGAWVQIMFLGIVITTMVGGSFYLLMRMFTSTGGTRLAGAIGGIQTQPAVLGFVNDRTSFDPRVALGYAMVYPVAMVAKIFIAQILGSFAGL
ncbi:aspartate:alanine exchanger family transporter [Arcanobacterium pinnipediorum]|uniref:Transporter n=1 Tax=Arcanobacterium pinnipediorum TaxID=1503041 RepID=A0ABY5AIH2_9ACTO|nr:TrkA C-terminal domain-containing protein [Arcanobacterium pinnipediorum]USR79791.1 transporter [Arcanobacterium pinnipediorum]